MKNKQGICLLLILLIGYSAQAAEGGDALKQQTPPSYDSFLESIGLTRADLGGIDATKILLITKIRQRQLQEKKDSDDLMVALHQFINSGPATVAQDDLKQAAMLKEKMTILNMLITENTQSQKNLDLQTTQIKIIQTELARQLQVAQTVTEFQMTLKENISKTKEQALILTTHFGHVSELRFNAYQSLVKQLRELETEMDGHKKLSPVQLERIEKIFNSLKTRLAEYNKNPNDDK